MKQVYFRIFIVVVSVCGSGAVWGQNMDSLQVKQQLDSLTKISRAFGEKRNFDDALRIATEIKSIIKSTNEDSSQLMAKCLFHFGWLHTLKGDYLQAENYYLQSKGLFESHVTWKNLDYATTLRSLATLYKDLGRYEEAKTLHLEVIRIRKSILGENHSEYGAALGGLAIVYYLTDQYQDAESLYLQILDIYSKNLGKESRDYASISDNLGMIYRRLGNYSKAESMYLSAKDIRSRVVGTKHLHYSNSLDNLGNFYRDLGQLEKAKNMFEEAITIREQVLGKGHQIYAKTLENLGVVYVDLQQYEKAEQLFLSAKEIFETSIGIDHPYYINNLLNIATGYSEAGKFTIAEKYYLEVLLYWKKNAETENPFYYTLLIALGGLYNALNDFGKAEQFLLEAKSVAERISGKQHPHFVQILNNLAATYCNSARPELAAPMFIQAENIEEAILKENMNYLSEVELEQLIQTTKKDADNLFSFTQYYDNNLPTLNQILWDHILFRKGVLLENSRSIEHTIIQSQDSLVKIHYQLWKSSARNLSIERSKYINERDQIKIDSMEEQVKLFEKTLVRRVSQFSDIKRTISWQDVQGQLRHGNATIEFMQYNYIHYRRTDSIFYIALVLLPNDTTPKNILLFEESQLQSLLAKTESRDESVTALYTRSGELLDPLPKYGTELYNLIWRPLDSLLKGVKTVYYSPSGLLHRVNLAALPISKKKVLADRFQLHQMGSTRSLVVKTPEPVPVNYTAALYGGILYNSDSTALAAAAQANQEYANGFAASHRSSLEYVTDVTRDTTHVWPYLPGTNAEIAGLPALLQSAGLKTQSFAGTFATEESLKALGRDTVKSPDILHIATHGFFFSDPVNRIRQTGDNNVFRWNENPLFRSGLIMAGADHAWQTGHPYQGQEDGILTAYEISHLNLSNTKLAVLSACETGLGDIKGSEGVYGLQRAFKMAGVDYLMVSLWKVPDEQTAEFMNKFYKYWLGGMTIHDAFTKAQRKMRKKYGVYAWGAWMLIE